MAVRLKDLTDVTTPTSGDTRHLLRFNVTDDTFDLRDMRNEPLEPAVDDDDLPETFITQLEQELEVDELVFRSVDGGSF